MDDEALAPFVDALAASLIVIILIAISFILQSALSLQKSAQQYVQMGIESDKFSPIRFTEPLVFNAKKQEIHYILNFKLSDNQKTIIQEQIKDKKQLHINIYTNETEKKATAVLIQFIAQLDIPESIKLTTNIEKTIQTTSKLTWEIQ